ncbi:hypothetical protein [Phenylobacterium sp. SCN 70-31]|uniref:hypothetical protein n=1 Tax=Phenylobacterium sp. SCN 70-31 TaxID=1660129 RepID=UPI000AEBDA5F|nr:hypothetical protein [Phenylobacterium sp. SCN 70-31]
MMRPPGRAPGAAARVLMVLCAASTLTSCSGRDSGQDSGQDSGRENAAPEAAPPPAPVAAASERAGTPPAKPAGAEAIDAALAAAQAFNSGTTADLAAVAREEQKIRQASAAAQVAARDGGNAEPRIAAARRNAEAARSALAAARTASASAASTQTAAVEAAVSQCAATPELAAYEGCVALTAEQVTLAQNIAALDARHAAADAVWSQERPRLEEAAAAVALAGLR